MTLFPNMEKNIESLSRDFSEAPRTGFVENTIAAWESVRHNDLFASELFNNQDAYDNYINDIFQGTGRKLSNPFKRIGPPELDPVTRRPLRREQRIESFFKQVDELSESGAVFEFKSREDIQAGIAATGAALEIRAEDVAGRATGFGIAGQFLGGVGATITDPPILLTLPFGAAASSGILRTAVIEGLVGAGTEAVIQPTIQGYRDELGLDSGLDRALTNILFAGVGGAGFGAGIKSLGKLASFSSKKLIRAFDDVVKKPAAAQRGARAEMENIAATSEANPLEPGGTARTEHENRASEGQKAAIDIKAPDIPERPVAAHVPPANLVKDDSVIRRFDVADIVVDAKRFQFKAEADQFGVTNRLKEVEKWDEIKAGVVVLWEDETGKFFVADGHQRVGLAKRLAASQPDIKLNGFVLKSIETISDIDARVIAAAKNIAEGTGSAIDAAKVLRDAAGFELNLPPGSALVRQAQNLARVSDQAFGMVVNEIVPANYAAIVGKLVDDEKLHVAIMEVLAEAQPVNVRQAESIVRQAQVAGATKEIQQSLFGEEEITTSLFKDRARILDKALKKLRSEKLLFRTLVQENKKITGAGRNRLDIDENLRQETINGRAEELIQRLAHSHGPISEALNDAARRARTEGRDAGGIDDFITVVRAQSGRSDFIGRVTGERRRASEITGEGREAPELIPERLDIPPPARVEPADLNEFVDPEGVGPTAQEAVAMTEFNAGKDGDDILLGFDVSDTGETVPQLARRGDLKQELKDDDLFATTLEGCAS